MSSLSKSRWAPSDEPQPRNSLPKYKNGLLPPSQELSRFMKIVARLKWKLPFLGEAYRLATVRDPSYGIDIAQAEIMFKLDFHEYYALLERALVHLLGVFGIAVSGKKNEGSGWAGSHRYHANVLDALGASLCPLRGVLGSGDRFGQLKRAKELRNRWKTADLSAEEKEREECLARRGETVMPLDSYDLEKILSEIFDGLEEGYGLAEAHAAQHDSLNGGGGVSSMDWDFIVDAMDWEAV